MSSTEDLSKEELLEKLKKIETESCKFLKRGSQGKCPNRSETPFGFCNKHKKTSQAIQAQLEYERKLIKETEETKPATSEDVELPKEEHVETREEPVKEELVKEEPIKEDVHDHASDGDDNTPVKSAKPSSEDNRRKEKTPDKSDDNTPEKKSKKVPSYDEVSEEDEPTPVTPKIVKKRKIARNKWGRYEDPESGIVFDPIAKIAIGYQDHENGKIYKLTKKHITICKQKGWKYTAKQSKVEESDSSRSGSESGSGSSSSGSDSDE